MSLSGINHTGKSVSSLYSIEESSGSWLFNSSH